MTLPFKGQFTLTSQFGKRTYWHNGKLVSDEHNGVDWGMPIGTPLYAIEDGYIRTGVDQWGGKYIALQSSADRGRRVWYYVHLDGFASTGWVKQGDIVGYSGNTGNSTGPHLHLGLNMDYQWHDPLLYLNNLNFTQNTMNGDFITVPNNSGWGVSHVAREAGFSDWQTESAWNRIAQLNGYANWQDLQKEFESGNVNGKQLRVRDAQPQPKPEYPENVTKLEAEIEALKREHALQLQKEAKDKLEALQKATEEIEKLKAESDEKTAELAKVEAENTQLLQDKEYTENKLEIIGKQSQKIDGVINLAGGLLDTTLFDDNGNLRKPKEIKTFWSKNIKSLKKYDWKYLFAVAIAGTTFIFANPEVSGWVDATTLFGYVGVSSVTIKLTLDRLGDALSKSGDRNNDGVFNLEDTEVLKTYIS